MLRVELGFRVKHSVDVNSDRVSKSLSMLFQGGLASKKLGQVTRKLNLVISKEKIDIQTLFARTLNRAVLP